MGDCRWWRGVRRVHGGRITPLREGVSAGRRLMTGEPHCDEVGGSYKQHRDL